MSYLGFHLVFILPPIVLLAAGVRRSVERLPPGAYRYLMLLSGIALVYTTPWDNYLVREGVWSYGAERVLGTIGYVPVEEYLFFVLQPVLTGLWFYRVAARLPAAEGARPEVARWTGALTFGLLTLAGVLLLRSTAGTYLGLILVWAGPVLALQWAYAGAAIWRLRSAYAVGVAVPTLYLWAADAFAIGSGIWTINERYTLGLAIGGFPLEEAVFFAVTNLLVVQGLILFLWPPRGARARSDDPTASVAR